MEDKELSKIHGLGKLSKQPDSLTEELLEKLKIENQSRRENNEIRKEYTQKIFNFVRIYIGCVLLLVAFQKYLELAPSTIIALLGSMSINVIGLLWLVVGYFFNSQSKQS